jgi:hypothetical protein
VATSVDELLAEMKENPAGVRFSDACKVADHFFGAPTQNASSHRVWKMPWPGNPRVNMQDDKGKAKPYQVRQLLEAVERRLSQLRAAADEGTSKRPVTIAESHDSASGTRRKRKRR